MNELSTVLKFNQGNIRGEMYNRVFGMGFPTFIDEIDFSGKYRYLLSNIDTKNKWFISSLYSFKYLFIKNKTNFLPYFKYYDTICELFSFDPALKKLIKSNFIPQN